MIAAAMQKVGNEGVITVEEAKGMLTELDVVEGMQFDRGYMSPYGGVALARASLILARLNAENADQRVGIEIVRKAVQMPLRQIAENAGEDGAVISGKVMDRTEYNWGFDAQTGEFKDMVKAGIIDPTKVVRSALQHAASVGSLMITTEAIVAERPEKPAANGGSSRGDGGMSEMDF